MKKMSQALAIRGELKRRDRERTAEAVVSPMSSLINKVQAQNVLLSEKQRELVEHLISLQEDTNEATAEAAAKTVEEIKALSQEVAETSKQGQEVRQIQTGKLTSVESNTRKQFQSLQEQNKILRELKAVDKELLQSSGQLTDAFREAMNGFRASDISEMYTSVSELSGLVSEVYDPRNKSLQVTVTNPTPQGGRAGGMIPFATADNVTKKALLDDQDRLYVNASGITLHAVVNTSASDGSSVYQATNPWIVGGTVSIAGGSINVTGTFSADATGSSVFATIVNDVSVDASGTTIYAVVNTSASDGVTINNWIGASGGYRDVTGSSVIASIPGAIDASGATINAVVNVPSAIAVNNFPTSYANAGGSVTAYQGATFFAVVNIPTSLDVGNFPTGFASRGGSVSVYQAETFDVNVTGGSIHVEATAEIEGATVNATIVNTPDVSVTNSGFASSGGSVTVYQGATVYAVVNTQGSVSVSNFPASFGVNGGSILAYQGGSWQITASDLDIRNLSSSQDSVDVSGSSVNVNISQTLNTNITGGSIGNTGFASRGGSVAVYQGDSPWVVDASGATINAVVNLPTSIAIDNFPASFGNNGGSVTIYQGATLYAVVNTQGGVTVNNFPSSFSVGGGSVTVYSSDLDIRNLSSAQDSVSVTGSSINANVSGTVNVSARGGSVTAFISGSISNTGFGASISNWSGASGINFVSNVRTSGVTQTFKELTGAAGITAIYSNPTGFVITDFWMSTDVAQKVRMVLDGVTLPAFSFAANGGMVSNNRTPLVGASQLSVHTGSSGVFSITLFGHNK